MASIFTDPEIEHIGTAFLARTLPKSEWTHAAHFAAALWMLRHHPELARPAERFGALVFAYNEATGTANTNSGGYHATITIASLDAVESWLQRYPADAPLDTVLNALLMTEQGRSDWLLRHWSRECLFSVDARRGWVEPDIMRLPVLAV